MMKLSNFKSTSIVRCRTSAVKKKPEVKLIFGRFYLAFKFHSNVCQLNVRAARIKGSANKIYWVAADIN